MCGNEMEVKGRSAQMGTIGESFFRLKVRRPHFKPHHLSFSVNLSLEPNALKVLFHRETNENSAKIINSYFKVTFCRDFLSKLRVYLLDLRLSEFKFIRHNYVIMGCFEDSYWNSIVCRIAGLHLRIPPSMNFRS
ncbi:hypothetical protein HAX54_029815 [Datura stramonium]|uniref:Uncharacterized protein n=1 Tax=Datura stramonium TaxID=4076 RepID=A0ABS8V8U9_DATST|nr:hypothetical protein [Datura stramonium]